MVMITRRWTVLTGCVLAGLVLYFMFSGSSVTTSTASAAEGADPESASEHAAPLATPSTPEQTPTTLPTQQPKNVGKTGENVVISLGSYDQLVASNEPWMIKFFNPACPHCQKIKQTWIDTAAALKGVINVGEVNCQEERELCTRHNIRGVPTIIFMQGKTVEQYKGPRTVEDFSAFAKTEIGK
eukprot:GAFH01005132.1.p1 GENE.GAFH01005132.1~~GAFH01005132.1.p1  ORF type:complete len:195 (+),score=9.55 GAFH01005132.1:35-586(+)